MIFGQKFLWDTCNHTAHAVFVAGFEVDPSWAYFPVNKYRNTTPCSGCNSPAPRAGAARTSFSQLSADEFFPKLLQGMAP